MSARIWVNMSAVIVHSTSEDSETDMPRSSAFWIGGAPWRMCISMGTESDTWAPTSAAIFQPSSVMPVMWMKMLSDPNCPAFASASKVGAMPKVPTTWSAMGMPSSRPTFHASS